MKQDVQAKWTGALTSGKYKQAQGALKERVENTETGKIETRHCCLGVLCELYRQEVKPNLRWSSDGSEYRTFLGAEDMPVKEVLDWAGLTQTQANKLAAFNDDDGLTFEQIAAKINEVNTVKWANQYGRGIKRKMVI